MTAHTTEIFLCQRIQTNQTVAFQLFYYKHTPTGKVCCSKKQVTWLSFILSAVLAVVTVAAVVVWGGETKLAEPADGDQNTPENYTSRVVKRGQWSIHSDVKLREQPIKPARFVIVIHSAGSPCNSTYMCQKRVRSIEAWHKQTGFSTIGYSFLIGGDGFIYEGRGWGKYGAFTYGFNCNSVGVAFVGNFDKDELIPSMVEAYNILVEEGLRRGALATNYKMLGHYQVKYNATDSPGMNIKKVLKSWPHWAPSVTSEDILCK